MNTEFDLAEVDRLLTTTRSVRKRLDLARPVDRETIATCLELANQAPSGSNAQRYRWVVVTDAAKRAEIGRIYREAYQEIVDPIYKKQKEDSGSASVVKVLDSAGYLAQILDRVPVHIIACTLDRPNLEGKTGDDAGYYGKIYPEHVDFQLAGFYGSVLPAVWSIQLALRSRGLGSAWTTLHVARSREIGELLGIPPTVTQVALLPVAHYTGEGFKPAPRRPASELTYWDGWKEAAPR